MSGRRNKAHDYDLARGVRFYDASGDLPQRAASLWSHISHAERDIAREFWRRYRQSEDLKTAISDEQLEELVNRILPYLRDKFLSLGEQGWVATARGYVEKALGAK